ncbi:MAG: hypothetical protein ACRDKB_01035 [Actinomycetota bacterium]
MQRDRLAMFGLIVGPSRIRARVIAAIVALAAVGCGGGDGTSGSGDLGAFCDQAIALDRLERHPTDDELDRLVEAAAEDIRDDSEILAASAREFRAGNANAAASEEIQEAGKRFDRFVEDNCDGG